MGWGFNLGAEEGAHCSWLRLALQDLEKFQYPCFSKHWKVKNRKNSNIHSISNNPNNMSSMAAATTSQLSCFSAMNRQLHLSRRSLLCPTTAHPKSLSLVVMSLEGGSKTKTDMSYTSDASKSKSDLILDDELVAQPKRAAKIHDFCFGIPFGGIVLGGGLTGFIFSRNPATLSSGVLFGGALLALSTFSLKIWRQGKSSLPFILGQAALAAVLLWNNFQTYALTKKVFPTGFYAAISAAMLCFYSYVVLSGGNPPPKKLRPSASAAS